VHLQHFPTKESKLTSPVAGKNYFHLHTSVESPRRTNGEVSTTLCTSHCAHVYPECPRRRKYYMLVDNLAFESYARMKGKLCCAHEGNRREKVHHWSNTRISSCNWDYMWGSAHIIPYYRASRECMKRFQIHLHE